jgi:hypothetical protein
VPGTSENLNPLNLGLHPFSGFILISASVFQTHDQQDRPGRDASGEQVQETLDTGGGFAGAS